MVSSGRKVLFVIVAVLAGAVGIAVAHWSAAPDPTERALVLEVPRALPEFSLRDHRGDVFDRSRLADTWTFIFFGFTNCPDVCPTTLMTLDQALDQIGADHPGELPAVVMVSVDPIRDDAEKLAGYLPYFDQSFVGVTGEMPEILALTGAMGVAFVYTPLPGGDGRYTVDHTASIFLIDPQGRLAAIFGTPHEASVLAADYLRIVDPG